jgi:hypothetical protein
LCSQQFKSKTEGMKKTILTALVVSLAFLNACKKEEVKKDFTLEMKVNGVLWTATKNIAGLYNTSTNGINITGQKGDETIGLSRDNVTGSSSYTIPTGSMTALILKAGTVIPYSANSSKPKSHGSVTFLTQSPSAVSNIKNIEADFSGVLYDSFNTDSVVITQGKLRYQ